MKTILSQCDTPCALKMNTGLNYIMKPPLSPIFHPPAPPPPWNLLQTKFKITDLGIYPVMFFSSSPYQRQRLLV